MTVREILFDYTNLNDAHLPCDSCVSTTYHVVLKSTDVKIGLMSAVGFEHQRVVQGQGCHNISFRTFTKIPDFFAEVRGDRKAKHIDSFILSAISNSQAVRTCQSRRLSARFGKVSCRPSGVAGC